MYAYIDRLCHLLDNNCVRLKLICICHWTIIICIKTELASVSFHCKNRRFKTATHPQTQRIEDSYHIYSIYSACQESVLRICGEICFVDKNVMFSILKVSDHNRFGSSVELHKVLFSDLCCFSSSSITLATKSMEQYYSEVCSYL